MNFADFRKNLSLALLISFLACGLVPIPPVAAAPHEAAFAVAHQLRVVPAQLSTIPTGCPQRFETLPQNIGDWEGYVHQVIENAAKADAAHRNEAAKERYVLAVSNWRLNDEWYRGTGRVNPNPKPKPDLAYGTAPSAENTCVTVVVQLPTPVMDEIPDPAPPAAPAAGVARVGGKVPGKEGWYFALPGDTVPAGQIVKGPDGRSYKRLESATPFGVYPYYVVDKASKV